MTRRYGRKQKRAHRSAMAEVERRAVESARRFQGLIGTVEERARKSEEALRLLGSRYGEHVLQHVVERATDGYLQRALTELGRNGLASMRVSLETRPDFRPGNVACEVKVVHVRIPEVEFRAVVDERLARHG